MAILQLNLCGLEHFPFEGCFTDCMGINESSSVKAFTHEYGLHPYARVPLPHKKLKLNGCLVF